MAAIATGLALAALLLCAGEARAGKYAVAQCGWHVGIDADWADSTGGAKFRPDSYCVPAPGADPFAGIHLKSFARPAQNTVSGTRFARWRWTAPPGTGITQVRGTWWHALHDGFEHRIGVGTAAGGFTPFASAASTDVTPREFVAGFGAPMPALEDRLLCARPESRHCTLSPESWSGTRALTITLEDPHAPGGGIGGPLTDGGWLRGTVGASVNGSDLGSGVRFGETRLDGHRVALTEYPCNMASIGGEWRGTRMQPCLVLVGGMHAVNTHGFADGPHTLVHCITDFASNVACTHPRTIRFDNTAPAHPRQPALARGEGWRRVNDFDLSWSNPDQGPGSPIAGGAWRVTGPSGYDTGARFAPGRGRTALSDVSVPRPGAYSLHVWLRDEAGNESLGSAATVPLRFDDVPPAVAFETSAGEDPGERLSAEVSDANSRPASGAILYRRASSADWIELPTKLAATQAAGVARLSAPMPDLTPGTYLFRADAADGAGNTASGTRRADGTEMTVRRVAPAVVPRARTRLFAGLGGGRGGGESVSVPFGAAATLSGRLTRADGAGIAGRELRVLSWHARGSIAPSPVATVVTGERGGFELRLGPGPSRQVTVEFPGDAGLEPSLRPSLDLRVRSGVTLRAKPPRLRTGQLVRFSGRVRARGAALPRRGKVVAIQYLEAASKRWRPVLVTRTDQRGRFHARYRFRYVKGRARIRLRATALTEERWPYAPGSSPSLTIRVSG